MPEMELPRSELLLLEVVQMLLELRGLPEMPMVAELLLRVVVLRL